MRRVRNSNQSISISRDRMYTRFYAGFFIDFLAWIKIRSERSVIPTLQYTQGNSTLVSMQTSMMRSTTIQSCTSSRTSAFTASRACPKARKQVVVSAQVRRGATCGKSAGLRSALQTVLGSDLNSALLRTGRGQNQGPSKGSQRLGGCSSCSAIRFDRHVSVDHRYTQHLMLTGR